MAEKLIKEMPYTVRPLRVQERQRPVVTVPQLEGFMDAIRRGHRNPQVPAAVTMALMLGLRESEVLGATWGALQGRNFVVRGVTKSKRIRTIPVPDEVWTSLGWMLVDLHPGITGPHPLPKLGLIFPGTRGTKHQQGWLRQALERGCPGLGMHRLRASFITAHLKAGTTLKDVQQMAGHADARTTIGYQETSLEEQAIRQQTLWKKA
jgi:integrase